MFLTFTCAYIDRNVIFFNYFAANESQSLAAILRNEEGAIDGALVLLLLGGVPAFYLPSRCSYCSRIQKDKEADRYAQVHQHLIMTPFPLNV